MWAEYTPLLYSVKQKEQEIGNLFEKIMKENFPTLVKEIDMQVQEAQRAPNKMDAKRSTPKTHQVETWLLLVDQWEDFTQASRCKDWL